MNVAAPKFVDLYSAEVENLKLKLQDYITSLTRIKNNEATGMSFGVGFGKDMPSTTLKLTQDGYPILEDPLPSAKWNKKMWEKFTAAYFGAHYSK
jgi:hypothetical protein